MANPKPKYAISDFEPRQYQPTASATAEDADNEFELQQYEPTAGRREDDETPLAKYNSESSTLFTLTDPVSNPFTDPYGSPPRKYCGMSKRAAWTTGVLVVIAIVALVTGLAVGLRPSVSSLRIPVAFEVLLNIIIEKDTRATY